MKKVFRMKHMAVGLKETVSRDFRPSVTPRPQMNTLKYFRILFRIRSDI
jgi:hypothetical protein